MKKLFVFVCCSLPLILFAQADSTQLTPHTTTVNTVQRNFNNGDTVVNLNQLNNGILLYQIADVHKTNITGNGLEIKDGGMIILVQDTLLKKDFSFDVKTKGSDEEWYENTIKIKVSGNDIRLISVTSDKIEMATGLRKDGKIYVVITVSAILFFVVIGYLIILERKVKKLTSQMNGSK